MSVQVLEDMTVQGQSLITSDNDTLGGICVFAGTRVPVKTLFDYLKADHPLHEFLEDFPTVGRRQAEAVLDISRRQWQEALHETAS